MFYIVESDSQIEGLKGFSEKGAYIEIITSNDNYHPILTNVVAKNAPFDILAENAVFEPCA